MMPQQFDGTAVGRVWGCLAPPGLVTSLRIPWNSQKSLKFRNDSWSSVGRFLTSLRGFLAEFRRFLSCRNDVTRKLANWGPPCPPVRTCQTQPCPRVRPISGRNSKPPVSFTVDESPNQ
jgi:hypothetical protein